MSRQRWVGFVSDRFIRRDRTKIMLIVAVAMSVATLICVLSIMNGLQFITINNLIQIESYHLIIQEPLSMAEQTTIRDALKNDEQFESIVAFAELQSIAHSATAEPRGVTIRAVNARDVQQDRRFIEQINVRVGSVDLARNRVIIGVPLARALQVGVGDELQIYGHSGQTENFMVSGLFRSGYPSFDEGLVVMSVARAQQAINATIPVHIGVKYRNPAWAPSAKVKVQEQTAAIIGREPKLVDWQETNRAIFSALKLEKIFITLILGIIFIIVAINIRQSLARKARQYESELAILKAMGGAPEAVQRIITSMGVYIGVSGGVIGVAVGLWLTLNIGGLFRLADVVVSGAIDYINSIIILLGIAPSAQLPYPTGALFFIGSIEHQLLLRECLGIFLFAVLISFIAAYTASQRVVSLHPIQALRSGAE